MAKRRYAVEISNINEDPRLFVDRNEIMKLTKVAKSWEFTCSFCFKKFPSAQAMGGHQNAHRSERLEEKRLFVRDPIGYRKRAYLRAMKADQSAAPAAVEEKNPTPINHQLHAPRKMATVKKESANMNEALSKKNILAEGRGFGTKNCFCKGSSSKDPNASSVTEIHKNDVKKRIPLVVMNFFPPKELSLAESVGVINGGDAKGKAAASCVREFDINGGYDGINLDQNLDLTLKL